MKNTLDHSKIFLRWKKAESVSKTVSEMFPVTAVVPDQARSAAPLAYRCVLVCCLTQQDTPAVP